MILHVQGIVSQAHIMCDVTHRFQVDGLTKVDEEGYTYEHYYGNKGFQQYGNDYK